MTKLEEMTRAFIAAELRRTKIVAPAAYIDRIYPESVPSMAEALKVLRKPSEAMLRAGTHDTNAFERMIDAVLAEKPE